jgi:hypothetical protein
LKELGNLFDPYERQARLFPAVLTLAPVLLLALAVYPSAGLSEFPKGFVAALLLLALCYVLAGLARAAGKRVQRELYVQWSGEPTTSMLRHRDATLLILQQDLRAGLRCPCSITRPNGHNRAL